MVARGATVLAIAVVGATACHWVVFQVPGPDPEPCVSSLGDAGMAQVSMNFVPHDPNDFFAAPFPAVGRVPGDYTGVADGPNLPVGSTAQSKDTPLAYRLLDLVPTNGYALSAAIFFELSANVDTSSAGFMIPATPVDSGASSSGPFALLFPLNDPGHQAAISLHTTTVQGHVILAILPVQGRPLLENTEYVAIVTKNLAGRSGAVDTMAALVQAMANDAGTQGLPGVGLPDGKVVAKYEAAIAAAMSVGVSRDQIAAMSVFTTTDPTAEMRAAVRLAHGDYMKTRGSCDVSLVRELRNNSVVCESAPYCIFEGTVALPQYQRGTPPFLPYVQWGGGWPSSPVPEPQDAGAECDDAALSQGPPSDPTSWQPTWRNARVVVTVPTAPPPTDAGYPVAVYVRAGAGTMTDPLSDRGPTVGPTCSYGPCQGPAEMFEQEGFAGITIDGPLTGESRLEPGFASNEDLAIFNFLNPLALRDNLRQSALELTLVPDILKQIRIDASSCSGVPASGVTFDLAHIAMFSHSMGSSIAPLALASDPRYGAAVLSGSGGSYIENVVYKANPIPINEIGSLIDLQSNCSLAESAIPLSLLQWSVESSDTQVYARRMVVDRNPPGASWWSPNARSVLMIQGLVDFDILPPIADTMTLAEGLDLGIGPNSCNGGDPWCDRLPVYGVIASSQYPSIADLLHLSGASYGDLSVLSGNVKWPVTVPRPAGVTGDLTALVVQHRIDENREPTGQDCIVNGHEAIYESTLARHQYACFLYDFARGKTPTVRAKGGVFTPCEP